MPSRPPTLLPAKSIPPCAECGDTGNYICVQCRQCSYCSEICQIRDFRPHSLVCYQWKHLPSRPSPQHRLGFLFPGKSEQPVLLWIDFQISMIPGLGQRSVPMLSAIMGTTITVDYCCMAKSSLRDVLMRESVELIFRSSVHKSGSARNLCIDNVTTGAGTGKWRGPVMAMSIQEVFKQPKTYSDITPADIGDVVDYLSICGYNGPNKHPDPSLLMEESGQDHNDHPNLNPLPKNGGKRSYDHQNHALLPNTGELKLDDRSRTLVPVKEGQQPNDIPLSGIGKKKATNHQYRTLLPDNEGKRLKDHGYNSLGLPHNHQSPTSLLNFAEQKPTDYQSDPILRDNRENPSKSKALFLNSGEQKPNNHRSRSQLPDNRKKVPTFEPERLPSPSQSRKVNLPTLEPHGDHFKYKSDYFAKEANQILYNPKGIVSINSILDPCMAVKIACKGDRGLLGERGFTVVRVLPNDPVFQAPCSPISKRVGYALHVRKYPEDLGNFDNDDKTSYMNGPATALQQRYELNEEDFGSVPEEWKGDIGSVCVARADQKDLGVHAVEALCYWSQYKVFNMFVTVMSAGDTKSTRSTVLEGITPSKFLEFFDQYAKDKGWTTSEWYS